MAPIIPIAMGLLEIAPALAGMFRGKKAKKAAEAVVGIAKAVSGIADPQAAVETIKGNPDLVLKFKLRVLDATLQGNLAEFAAQAERWRDIRESGWWSSHVRPFIATTFHVAVWGVILCDTPENAKTLLGIELFTWGSATVTIGAAYVLIIAFYFLTKGMKDYFISKNPIVE